MRKNNKNLTASIGAALFIGTLSIVAYAACNVDRMAQSRTYDINTTYDGHKISVEHNGENHEYIIENDVLTHIAIRIDSGVCYDEMPEDLWENVEPNTLVWVRFNDNGTDDVSDDIPVLIGYDTIGMSRRTMQEFDARLAENGL